jgi:tetratricopeptide (TPR) repeat protein
MAKVQKVEAPKAHPVHEVVEYTHDFISRNKILLLSALVVLILIVASAVIYQKEKRDKEGKAWLELSNAKAPQQLEDIVAQSSGTGAEPWILCRLGDALYGEGKFDKAAEAYEKALKVPGRDIIFKKMLYLNLACADEEMKKYDEAEGFLQKLADLPGEDYWKKEAKTRLEFLKELKEAKNQSS